MNLRLLVLFVLVSQILVMSWYLGISSIFVAIFGVIVGSLIGIVTFVTYFEIALLVEDLSRVDVGGKSVFITGCDSGFGLLLAESLVKKGMFVFAGVLNLNSDGAKNLQSLSLVKVIKLDVVKDEEVDEAFVTVNDHLSKTHTKLWAVVNNAGIGYCKMLEFTDFDKIRQMLEVNTFGMLRMCKKFAPLLRGHGRIVNITSIAGLYACPFVGPYTISKFAAEAVSRTLRMEMYPLGISVISIQPGVYKTPILSIFKGIFGQSEIEVYGDNYMTKCQEIMDYAINLGSSNVSEVTSCMLSAILNKKFQYSYNPGLPTRVLLLLFEVIFDKTSLISNEKLMILPWIPGKLL